MRLICSTRLALASGAVVVIVVLLLSSSVVPGCVLTALMPPPRCASVGSQHAKHGAPRDTEALGDELNRPAFATKGQNATVALIAEDAAGATRLVVAAAHERAGEAA